MCIYVYRSNLGIIKRRMSRLRGDKPLIPCVAALSHTTNRLSFLCRSPAIWLSVRMNAFAVWRLPHMAKARPFMADISGHSPTAERASNINELAINKTWHWARKGNGEMRKRNIWKRNAMRIKLRLFVRVESIQCAARRIRDTWCFCTCNVGTQALSM